MLNAHTSRVLCLSTPSASSWASSNYHALQVKLEKRYTKGFTLLASYTYAKLMDCATGVFNGESVGATTTLASAAFKIGMILNAEYALLSGLRRTG